MAEAETKHKEEEGGVRFQIEEKASEAADAEGDDDESDVTDPELETTIPPTTPRPSITAAIRRGSFYGDVKARASIVDVLSDTETESDWSEKSSGSTTGGSACEDESVQSSVDDTDDEEQLSTKFRVYIMGFLEGMLERLSLMATLPGATSIHDTSINLEDVPDGLPVLTEKKELLDAANLIHFSLGIPSKLSKFTTETAWLTGVLTTVNKEVVESSSFSVFQDVMDKDELKIRRLPSSIAHVKELKDKMDMLHVLIEAEAQTQKEAMREWAKNIAERKKELKELRADNMVQYRYKADTALASGDLCRRDFEVRLVNLRAENVRLKHDLEVEKNVHDASVEFLKKQNIDLREEAVSLQASFEIDVHNLDHMLEKMKLQKKDKELILAELEPRYMKEMAELEAARLEAIKQEEYFYANQGKCELQLVAVMRIQRIWRGFLVRKIYRKVLKKLKRKRLKAAKKAKKGGGKKKGGARKKKK
ncbi:hypothetical protein MPTK1_1g29570 [Marchantia polymorpha subsp. ruderalis]|uniref:Dynein regulatory complex protein 9 n=2 Tax=Marchantia polymorpha TaxID=3197 RepID=A0AAF6AVL8_MARPO|nr:hypothetical protein MARPO_0139s0016 [Marchantia polymorpha]BBN00489.1 hypothetical protein Mp_1g29570 [Marchantia polymorpha subsp. ruderalis]|eukprot:PTQ29540.1 hypothetical protein MARPO_0139s0016 [Marchantia polymorpha]